MPYIGRSENFGVRSRFQYQATASQTSFSGSDANSYTKNESDTRYPFKGNNSIIRLNGQTISADITIDSDENGVSAGPITQSATVTVNGYWSIV